MPTPQNLTILLWEIAMEAARIAVDPDLCSRLNCTFVWETLELAVSFRNQNRPNAHIFELEAVSDNPMYRGDFSLITHNNPTHAYSDYMSEMCKKYWTTPASEAPEILYGGSLRVVKRLYFPSEPLVVKHATNL